MASATGLVLGVPPLGGGLELEYSTSFDGAAGAPGAGWSGTWQRDGSGNLNPVVSVGSELLINAGTPFSFTGDDPDNWTIVGESAPTDEVSEVGAGQTHGGAGTGYCNIYATTAGVQISQNVLTVNTFYRFSMIIDAVASGGLNVNSGGLTAFLGTSTGTKTGTMCAPGIDFTLRRRTGTDDITISSASAKEITLSTTLETRQFDFNYGQITLAFTRTVDTNFGIVLNYTDVNNFGLVFTQPSVSKIRYGKMESGTWSYLDGGGYVYTYSAGKTLVVGRNEDGTVDITYNSGSLATGATASGLSDPFFGIFGTDNASQAHSFAYQRDF